MKNLRIFIGSTYVKLLGDFISKTFFCSYNCNFSNFRAGLRGSYRMYWSKSSPSNDGRKLYFTDINQCYNHVARIYKYGYGKLYHYLQSDIGKIVCIATLTVSWVYHHFRKSFKKYRNPD